jgi:hypothetical protein
MIMGLLRWGMAEQIRTPRLRGPGQLPDHRVDRWSMTVHPATRPTETSDKGNTSGSPLEARQPHLRPSALAAGTSPMQ